MGKRFDNSSLSSTNSTNSAKLLSYAPDAKIDAKKIKRKIIKRIGAGSFGTVYKVEDNGTGEYFALKFEAKKKNRKFQLESEEGIYNLLKDEIGFPRLYAYCKNDMGCALLLEYMGPSVQDLFSLCNHGLSEKTILMLAYQKCANIHAYDYLHRDIKPGNLVVGRGKDSHKLNLIDFGLATKYRCRESGQSIKIEREIDFIGTLRFAAKSAHKGVMQGRKDDLESLGYVLVFLQKGTLPWVANRSWNDKKRHKYVAKIKCSYSVKKLCKTVSPFLLTLLEYVNSLDVQSCPDYDFIKKAVLARMCELKHSFDYCYDWSTK